MINIFNFWIIFILIVFGLGCQKKYSREKDLRIISLSPHITEIIYAIKADERLLAVTDYCRYPVAAREKEKIGGLIDPNIEKIVSLKPTHLFGVPAHAELNENLGQFGLQIHMYPNETWQDMLATIDSIARETGYQQQGRALRQELAASLDSVKVSNDARRPAVMLLIGHEAGSLRNATVAGPNTFIDEMLNTAGGRNIYMDLGMRYGTVNIESMLTRKPDLIIDLMMNDTRGIQRIAVNATWSVLSSTPAVQKGQIFSVAGDHTMIPGPRMLWLAQDFRAVMDSVSRMR